MDLRRTRSVASLLVFLWAMPAVSAGEVMGTVHLEGPVPSPAVVTIEPKEGNHSTAGCGSLSKPSPRLLVSANGGIQNAVVWLEAPREAAAEPPASALVLDQEACVFVPHVLIVPLGGELAIGNSDPIEHNVRIFRDGRMLMHEWQPPKGERLRWRFEEAGRYLVRCGVHSWMYAWIVIGEHSYYTVTDAAGRFAISGVPDGTYTLRIWHETLGEHQQRVTVTAASSPVTVRLAQERGSS